MDYLIVEYVGLKPKETDCVAGTGLTWTGKGDRQDVPAKAWDIMKRHPDVWALVGPAPARGLAAAGDAATQALRDENETLKAENATLLERVAELEKAVGAAHKYVLAGEDGKPIVLDTMSVDEIKAWANANNVEFDGRTRAHDKLAAEVFANATKA